MVARTGDQPGRMPRGAGSEFMLFQEHNITDTELGEVVSDRTADNTAADDDDPRASG